jgi:hypothetical protein
MVVTADQLPTAATASPILVSKVVATHQSLTSITDKSQNENNICRSQGCSNPTTSGQKYTEHHQKYCDTHVELMNF